MKPLTAKILSNPYHPITKHLLYIYSMESFVYGELNETCRNKDKTRIKYYGAYAAALGYSIYCANKKRNDKLQGDKNLYRGLTLRIDEVDKFYYDKVINLTGYTSTSLDKETA